MAKEGAKQDNKTPARTQDRGKVLFSGMAHVREITRADWRAVGVDGPTVRWDWNNLYMVPVEELSFLNEAQFDAYIKGDSGFKIVAGDAKIPNTHPNVHLVKQVLSDEPVAAEEEGPAGGGAATGSPTSGGGSTAGATSAGGGGSTGGSTT